jgi:catechol 2,3-dioxygenase-like lactoylglutathione lyase family enzyme
MILYVTLGTNDLTRAAAFYDTVLPVLGLVRLCEAPDELGYGPSGSDLADAVVWIGTPYDERTATIGNGSMLALTADTRMAVDTAYAAALANGGSDEGAPGLRRYGPHFYAAYVRDPDGNKLSFVCQKPQPD